ncbi:MAG: type II secretion system protein [Candidatus Cloacimonetes bacterium]|nr:type II secretion system protein [Candidatus Cloacimonadota bacterium]
MSDNTLIQKKKKFSLIELLMIIMIVGILVTLIIPLRNDKIVQGKLAEAIRNIQVIARANVAYRDDPKKGNGSYMYEHTVVKYYEAEKDTLDNFIPAYLSGDDLLNVLPELTKENEFFYFDYFVTDTTVVARTNKIFGRSDAEIYYYLPGGPWGIGSDNVSKAVFDPNWLP